MINKSLSALGLVISALAEGSVRRSLFMRDVWFAKEVGPAFPLITTVLKGFVCRIQWNLVALFESATSLTPFSLVCHFQDTVETLWRTNTVLPKDCVTFWILTLQIRVCVTWQAFLKGYSWYALYQVAKTTSKCMLHRVFWKKALRANFVFARRYKRLIVR